MNNKMNSIRSNFELVRGLNAQRSRRGRLRKKIGKPEARKVSGPLETGTSGRDRPKFSAPKRSRAIRAAGFMCFRREHGPEPMTYPPRTLVVDRSTRDAAKSLRNCVYLRCLLTLGTVYVRPNRKRCLHDESVISGRGVPPPPRPPLLPPLSSPRPNTGIDHELLMFHLRPQRDHEQPFLRSWIARKDSWITRGRL